MLRVSVPILVPVADAEGSDCLPCSSVHPWSPLMPLHSVVTSPFPRPLRSDTIPIANRPAVQFNLFHLAGQFLRPWACSAEARWIKASSLGRVVIMYY
jgi:hypothetical protein